MLLVYVNKDEIPAMNKSWLVVGCCRVRARTCVGVSCNIACLLTVLLKPYMPQTADTMASQINVSSDLFLLTENVYQTLPSGHKIGKVRLPNSFYNKLTKK